MGLREGSETGKVKLTVHKTPAANCFDVTLLLRGLKCFPYELDYTQNSVTDMKTHVSVVCRKTNLISACVCRMA